MGVGKTMELELKIVSPIKLEEKFLKNISKMHWKNKLLLLSDKFNIRDYAENCLLAIERQFGGHTNRELVFWKLLGYPFVEDAQKNWQDPDLFDFLKALLFVWKMPITKIVKNAKSLENAREIDLNRINNNLGIYL